MPQLLDGSSDAAALKAYRHALLAARPRWQTVLFLVAGLIGSFLLPAILLCGWLSQQHIVWAITATTLATGGGYLWAGWTAECRSSERQRIVDDLLLSGILLIAAALLMAQIAVQTGPMQQRTLGFWLSTTTVVIAAVAGAYLMRRRALRLVSTS